LIQCEISKIKYSSRKEGIKLKGYCDPKINSGNLLLQERIKGNDLYIPRDIEIPCKVKNGAFIVLLEIPLLLNLLNHTDIWDCFFVSNENKHRIIFPKNNTHDDEYPILINTLLVIIYKTTQNELSIRVETNDTIVANLLSYSEKNNQYIFKGDISGKKLSAFQSVSLSMRKRDNKNSIIYSNETIIPLTIQSSNTTWEANFNKQSIFPSSSILHEEIWDAFIKLENVDHTVHYVPISNKSKVNDHYETINKNKFFEAKFYINKKNCIALWIKRKPVKFVLNTLKLDDDRQLIIECKSEKNLTIIDTRLEIEIDKWSDRLGGFYLDGAVFNTETEISLTIPLQKLNEHYKLEKNNQFSINVMVEEKETNNTAWIPLSISSINEFKPISSPLSSDFIGSLKISEQHSIVITVTDPVADSVMKVEPVKLAVLGTCYTRGAFNSNTYFNPGYKEKYDVVYTQFHSSMPSLMSLPLEFPLEYFTNKNKIEIEYLRCEFEKLFFKRLSEANAEYFLFDLYPDAVRDLIVYDDEHIITGNFYLRNRPFLQSLKDKVQIISHDNEEQFLKYWCLGADRFIEKILEYFPQNKIILQKARMINRYYDENRQVKYFNGDFNLVKRSNAYFKFMESYILSRLPAIHTIDLNNYGYIGQYNHPYLKSVNHYEPAYYKKLMQKLDKIVFEN
jgi:hypothetical protein